jgi:Lsr2
MIESLESDSGSECGEMAQRTQVLYVDDIDGSDAEGTVRFGLGGTGYEIDLNKKHAAQFAEAIAPYVAAARKAPSSRRPARAARHGQSDVRAWARGQGIEISDRGRIPADVLARYQAAH